MAFSFRSHLFLFFFFSGWLAIHWGKPNSLLDSPPPIEACHNNFYVHDVGYRGELFQSLPTALLPYNKSIDKHGERLWYACLFESCLGVPQMDPDSFSYFPVHVTLSRTKGWIVESWKKVLFFFCFSLLTHMHEMCVFNESLSSVLIFLSSICANKCGEILQTFGDNRRAMDSLFFVFNWKWKYSVFE